jgi:hypothetical protein
MSTPGTECFRPLKRTPTTIALQPRKRIIRIENSSYRCPACCSKLDTFSYSSLNKPFLVRKATNTPMEQTTKTITKARNRWVANRKSCTHQCVLFFVPATTENACVFPRDLLHHRPRLTSCARPRYRVFRVATLVRLPRGHHFASCVRPF